MWRISFKLQTEGRLSVSDFGNLCSKAITENYTFNNSGSQESSVSERTFEQWTPRLLQQKKPQNIFWVQKEMLLYRGQTT